MKNVSFIILAAGKSKRMKSNKSKVLHSLGDRPLLNFVYDIAKKNSSSKINFVCSDEVKHYVEMITILRQIFRRRIVPHQH